jgi:WhiB family redox-sensing transcriptional regulator
MADRHARRSSLAPREDWESSAACAEPGIYVEMFGVDESPESELTPATRQALIDMAVEVCHRCPVMMECREFALRTDQVYGVWGGLSARERSSIQRRGRRKLVDA